MATIVPFLRSDFYRDSVFEPHDIKAMSIALDDVCKVMNLQDDSPGPRGDCGTHHRLGPTRRAQPDAPS